MNGVAIKIEVEDGELKKIFNELTAAQEKINECYNRLIDLGVVTVTGGNRISPPDAK